MSTKRKRRKQATKTVRQAAKNAASDVFQDLKRIIEDGLEYPEDLLEHALLLFPVALVKAIFEIKTEKRKPIPADVRKAVARRDKGRCVIRACTYQGKPDLHHIKRVADGGKNTVGNLVSLCPNHHRLVHLGKTKLPKLRTKRSRSRQATKRGTRK